MSTIHAPSRSRALRLTRSAYAVGLLLGLATIFGCSTNIVPLKPITTVEEWVPVSPAGSSTLAATETAPASQAASTEPATMADTQAAATAPGAAKLVKRTRRVDPNQAVSYVYRGDYQHIWQEASALLVHLGYTIDRHDYRLGVLTSTERLAAQVAEPWRRDQTNISTALENTVNQQHRRIRITIKVVPDRPEFYEVAVQVIVERLTNPQEMIGGSTFFRGSGFGAAAQALQTDYLSTTKPPAADVPAITPPTPDDEPATQPTTTRAYDPTTRPAAGGNTAARWAIRGHEPKLEQKILKQLLDRI